MFILFPISHSMNSQMEALKKEFNILQRSSITKN